MAGSLWIIAGSVLLLLMSSFVVGQEGENERLLISNDEEVPQNPLSLIFVKESSELTIRFGISFLDELRLLKDSCMTRAVQMEGNFRDALVQLKEWQYQTQEILDSSEMGDGMSEEQVQYLRERLNDSLNELLEQQDKAKKALTDNCTNQYQKMIDDKMRSIIGYANAMLLDGGVETYMQLLDGIREYGQELQIGLNDCIDLYTPYLRRHNGMRGGSTDTLCMITEVQTLIEFIRSFLMQMNELVETVNNSSNVTPTSTDIKHEPLSPSPTTTDNHHHHHGHHGNHHHGHHHHGHHHHSSHPHPHHPSNEPHPPHPSNEPHPPHSSNEPHPPHPSNEPHPPHPSNEPHPPHPHPPHPHPPHPHPPHPSNEPHPPHPSNEPYPPHPHPPHPHPPHPHPPHPHPPHPSNEPHPPHPSNEPYPPHPHPPHPHPPHPHPPHPHPPHPHPPHPSNEPHPPHPSNEPYPPHPHPPHPHPPHPHPPHPHPPHPHPPHPHPPHPHPPHPYPPHPHPPHPHPPHPHPPHPYPPHPSNEPHPPHPSNEPHPPHPSNEPHPPHPSNEPHPQHESHSPYPTAHIAGSITANPMGQDHHELSTILIYAGVLSCLFIVSVIMIGGALLCIRFHGNKRKDGWKHLSEEEKVSQMKSAGYVNPTYKFFDQVTQ